MAADGPSYIGNVKSFNQAKGWGFIECPETQAIHGTDVFLLRGQILNNADIGRGDQVSFQVLQGEKGAQAANVQVLQSASTPDGKPTTVQGPYRGVIKNFSIEKGFGFIACDATHQQFGKDIFIMKSELPNTPIPDGLEVSFFVRVGEKGPQATRVQVDYGKGNSGYGGGKGKCSGGYADPYGKGDKGAYSYDAASYGKGAAYGKGYGGGQYGSPGGYDSYGYAGDGYGGGADASYASGYGGKDGCGIEKDGYGYGKGGKDGYGSGKDSYSSGKDGYGSAKDGYGGYTTGNDGYSAGYGGGKDGCYGGGYCGGYGGKDGYGAAYAGGKDGGYGYGSGKDGGYGPGYGKDGGFYKGNVESGAGWGNASAAFGAQSSYAGCKGGPGAGWGGCCGCGKGAPINESQVYFGTIKLVHAEKGWGLISCDAVQKLIGKEVFVMKSNMDLCPGLVQGSPVMFNVQNGPKGPHGINVRQAPDAAQTFIGTIRSYNPTKGWGFINCPESAELFQGDVFVHANALNGAVPSGGEQISFTVDTSKGRPAAANVVLAGGGDDSKQGGYGPADGASGQSQQYSPY